MTDLLIVVLVLTFYAVVFGAIALWPSRGDH
jgi:hypothetical protein